MYSKDPFRCCIYEVLAHTKLTPETSVVLIPGVGTPNPKSWGLCQTPWRDFLASLNNQGVIIHGYDHQIPCNETFTWQHLLEGGHELLSALASFLDGLSVSKARYPGWPLDQPTYLTSTAISDRSRFYSFAMALEERY